MFCKFYEYISKLAHHNGDVECIRMSHRRRETNHNVTITQYSFFIKSSYVMLTNNKNFALNFIVVYFKTHSITGKKTF